MGQPDTPRPPHTPVPHALSLFACPLLHIFSSRRFPLLCTHIRMSQRVKGQLEANSVGPRPGSSSQRDVTPKVENRAADLLGVRRGSLSDREGEEGEQAWDLATTLAESVELAASGADVIALRSPMSSLSASASTSAGASASASAGACASAGATASASASTAGASQQSKPAELVAEQSPPDDGGRMGEAERAPSPGPPTSLSGRGKSPSPPPTSAQTPTSATPTSAGGSKVEGMEGKKAKEDAAALRLKMADEAKRVSYLQKQLASTQAELAQASAKLKGSAERYQMAVERHVSCPLLRGACWLTGGCSPHADAMSWMTTLLLRPAEPSHFHPPSHTLIPSPPPCAATRARARI